MNTYMGGAFQQATSAVTETGQSDGYSSSQLYLTVRGKRPGLLRKENRMFLCVRIRVLPRYLSNPLTLLRRS